MKLKMIWTDTKIMLYAEKCLETLKIKKCRGFSANLPVDPWRTQLLHFLKTEVKNSCRYVIVIKNAGIKITNKLARFFFFFVYFELKLRNNDTGISKMWMIFQIGCWFWAGDRSNENTEKRKNFIQPEKFLPKIFS